MASRYLNQLESPNVDGARGAGGTRGVLARLARRIAETFSTRGEAATRTGVLFFSYFAACVFLNVIAFAVRSRALGEWLPWFQKFPQSLEYLTIALLMALFLWMAHSEGDDV